MPSNTASLAPPRAINSDPGTAAMAKQASGSPINSPIWVSDIPRSAWICGMMGGTTNSVSRIARPASQSRQKKRRLLPCIAAAFDSEGGMRAADFQNHPASAGGALQETTPA